MEISLLDLKRIITSAAELGVENYMKVRDPETDLLKQADAKRYLNKYGIPTTMLKKWSENCIITPIKTGNSQNAPVMYSLAELKQAILTAQVYNAVIV